MKRIEPLRMLLLAALLLGPGCGADNQTGRKLKIGVSIPAADHGWTAGVGYWAKTAMERYPDIEWIYATANEPGKQTGDIEDMMTQNVDGLVILATESAPITPVAQKAKERGIFLVSVDRGFTSDIADVFVKGDNRAFGKKSAEYIVERLKGKGKIVILRGIPSTVDTDRFEAAMEVFNANKGIQVLAAQPGMWNQQKALEVMQSYLASYLQIDAVWASDDDMALGVEKAIQEAGRAGQMWVLGGAGMKDIVKRVMDKDPLYPADITYPPAMIAAGIDIAAAHLKEGSMGAAAAHLPEHLGITKEQLDQAAAGQGQKNVTIDVFMITPENAGTYYFPDSVF